MSRGSLISLLHATRPRENAGSITAGRYGYQANVGILKLLELHDVGGEFCLVFDYLDDIAVLDHPTSPQSIRLYQVKTKDPGEWTVSSLCKFDGKTKPRSIIARMYAHSDAFGAFLSETGLVSNAAFKVQLAVGGSSSGTHHLISSQDIHADDLKQITRAIEREYSPASVASWLPNLVLIRAPLGVHSHEATIKGLLNDFLDRLGIAEDLNLSAIYGALHASIASKMGFSQQGLPYTELLARKSLSHSDFAELLDRARKRGKSFLSDWDMIARDIEKSGRGSAQIIRIKSWAVRYHGDRCSGQSQARAFRVVVETWIAKNITVVQTCSTLTALAETMQRDVDPCEYPMQEAFAALIVEAYEAIYETR